jgi:NAD(P)-dependent dehydrogenase (short-subunit alcohol dehydrogenase family)
MTTKLSIIPNGKVALITGANSGIGKITAQTLALQGYHVFLACRDAQKTQAVLAEIAASSNNTAQAEFLPLDLADLDSVRACAAQFLARNLPLHILINNAGLAGFKGLTKSGFEKTFGVCHIGHFLLTHLLHEVLKTSAPARVVTVASVAHRHAKGINFPAQRQKTASAGGFQEYAVAKLANILFSKALAHRLQGTGVTTYALHPWVVGTNVWRSIPSFLSKPFKYFMLTETQGAETTLYCATNPAIANETGLYYTKSRPARVSRIADDTALAEQLWSESERWLGL